MNTPNIRQSMVIIALITFNAVACTFFSLFLPICFHLHSVLIFRYMHFDFCYIEHAIILSKMPCNEFKLTFILVFSLAILKIHLVPLCKRKATKAHYITFKTEKSFNCWHLCVKSTKYTDNQIYGSFSMNQMRTFHNKILYNFKMSNKKNFNCFSYINQQKC